MTTHSPPPDPTGFRSVLDLCVLAQVAPETVRRDIKMGKIGASKVGRTYVLTPADFEAARAYYRERDRALLERHGAV